MFLKTITQLVSYNILRNYWIFTSCFVQTVVSSRKESVKPSGATARVLKWIGRNWDQANADVNVTKFLAKTKSHASHSQLTLRTRAICVSVKWIYCTLTQWVSFQQKIIREPLTYNSKHTAIHYIKDSLTLGSVLDMSCTKVDGERGLILLCCYWILKKLELLPCGCMPPPVLNLKLSS